MVRKATVMRAGMAESACKIYLPWTGSEILKVLAQTSI